MGVGGDGKGRWDGSGSWVRGGGCIGCKPCVDTVLQSSVAAIVWNRLAIRKVDAAVLDCSTSGFDIFHSSGAVVNYMARLSAECTAIDPGLPVEEGRRFRGEITGVGLLDWKWLGRNRC